MHYLLDVMPTEYGRKPRNIAKVQRHILASGGLRHGSGAIAEQVAKRISGHVLVERVSITCVSEHHVAMWRNGRRTP